MGPGVTGFLIDYGVYYPAQIAAMGLYCLIVCVLMVVVCRRIIKRSGSGVTVPAGA